jgi:hypothetical protein
LGKSLAKILSGVVSDHTQESEEEKAVSDEVSMDNDRARYTAKVLRSRMLKFPDTY